MISTRVCVTHEKLNAVCTTTIKKAIESKTPRAVHTGTGSNARRPNIYGRPRNIIVSSAFLMLNPLSPHAVYTLSRIAERGTSQIKRASSCWSHSPRGFVPPPGRTHTMLSSPLGTRVRNEAELLPNGGGGGRFVLLSPIILTWQAALRPKCICPGTTSG